MYSQLSDEYRETRVGDHSGTSVNQLVLQFFFEPDADAVGLLIEWLDHNLGKVELALTRGREYLNTERSWTLLVSRVSKCVEWMGYIFQL